jgi:hypothetical protein
MAIFMGVLGAGILVVFVPLTLLTVSAIGAHGGHLPWPAVQWTFTTPVGALVLIALCFLVMGTPLVLFALWQLRREVALSVDVTGVPPWVWPGPWQIQTRPWPPSLHGWLGHARREHVVNLTLLILGLLLAGGLLGTFVASGLYGFNALGSVPCDANGNACPPTFPLTGIIFPSWFAAIALTYGVRSRRLRRIEAASGVWLRYRDWTSMPQLCYLRPPGVTPEAAAAALGRFSSSSAVPFARRFFIGALVGSPYVVLASASLVVSAWLRLAWIPG